MNTRHLFLSFALFFLGSALFAVPASTSAPPVAKRGGASPHRVHALTPPVLLADGAEFRTWEPATIVYSRDYYVRQNHPAASDENPGTVERPFRTLRRAAEIVRAGERVLIDEGVYREVLRPVRGGESPQAMIGFEAMSGTRPVVSGAEVIPSVGWERVVAYRLPPDMLAKIRVLRIPESVFPDGAEPFTTRNLSPYMADRFTRSGWISKPANIAQSIGYAALLLQDGRRLGQVTALNGAGAMTTKPHLIEAGPGHFWPDPDGRTIYVWPFDDADPAACVWEVAVRRHCVDPQERGLGYLSFKGLVFENTGNPFPMPQSGMISTRGGHHWIIEDNHLRRANSIGIDLGVSHWTLTTPPLIGNHIVRGNLIEECGIGAICGTGSTGAGYTVQIEHNTIRGVAYHPVESMHESAAIKLHFAYNSLIRGNVIEDTAHGSAIWLDNNVANNRVTGNRIVNTRTEFGAVFIELTEFANLIDSNVIIGGSGAGIYEHDSGAVVVVNNLIATVSGPAVRLRGGFTPRARELRTGGHVVANNLFIGCKTEVSDGSKDTIITANHAISGALTFDHKTGVLVWPSFTGSLTAVGSSPAVREDFWGRPLATRAPVVGPFGRLPAAGASVSLGNAGQFAP